VVAEDLFAPHLNFVFGEADAQRGVAVFSIARLLEASPSTSIGIDLGPAKRTAKPTCRRASGKKSFRGP